MSKSQLYFVTGNGNKFREVQALIPDIEQLELDLPEIQSLDSEKIITAKLKAAQKQHQGRFIVDDTSLSFTALNGLPGPLVKWFLESLGVDGLWQLIAPYEDKTAVAQATIGYSDAEGKIHIFTGRTSGTLVQPSGERNFGWDALFQPTDAQKTYGQMTLSEKNQYSHRQKAITKLKAFLS